MPKRQYLSIDKLRARAQQHAFVKVGGAEAIQSIPASFTLRNHVPEVYNQGQAGSCTSNAFCGSHRIQYTDKTFRPSRLFLYFYERLAEDPRHLAQDLRDTGADVIDGENYVLSHGICSESLWPYDISKLNVTPPANCTQDALKHKIKSFVRLGVQDIKSYLVQGIPVLLAVILYQSFETNVRADGKVPMPDKRQQPIGGHEMCIVGYDDASRTYEVLNSWGAGWGDHGYCHIPYDYINDSQLCIELTAFRT